MAQNMDLEEKFNFLTDIVQQLAITVANHTRENEERTQPPHHTPRVTEDKTLRLDLLEFDGHSHNPETYLDWEANLERYFEFKDTPPEQQFKLAKIRLTKLAAVWLEGVQKQRRREDRKSLNTWEKLKKHLRRKYVPRNFRQQLYMQWGTLRQDHRSVSDYIQEWEKLAVMCDTNETEEMMVGKFVGGLREDLRKKLEIMPNLTFSLACSTALTLEKYSKKKSSSSSTYTRPYRPNTTRGTPSPASTTNQNQTSVPNKTQPPLTQFRNKDFKDPKGVVCFKCHGHGHIKSECPNARAFTVQEWNVIREASRPKSMLVSRNGKEEMVGPCTNEDDPDGTYVVGEDGEVKPLEDTEDSEEEDREVVYPEHER